MMRFAEHNDIKALGHLYDACGNDLYHFLLTQTDAETARDVCQKTWLKVIERKHQYRNHGKFSAWLFTLGRHILIDQIRADGKLYFQDPTTLKADHVDPPIESLSQQFDRALRGLPIEQREAFCLQQEGFSMQEIAQITHSNSETIKSRIRYAKQTLQRKLEGLHAPNQ